MLPIPLDVPFGKAEVKNKDLVGSLVQPNTEIVWLDISVNKVPVMDIFNPGDHLINQHQNSFERKLSESLIKERFQRRSHEIHDKDVVIT